MFVFLIKLGILQSGEIQFEGVWKQSAEKNMWVWELTKLEKADSFAMINFTIYRTAIGQDISPIKSKRFMGAEYTRLVKHTHTHTHTQQLFVEKFVVLWKPRCRTCTCYLDSAGSG